MAKPIKIRSIDLLPLDKRAKASKGDFKQALEVAEKQLATMLADSGEAMYTAINKQLKNMAHSIMEMKINPLDEDDQIMFDNFLKLAEKSKKAYETLDFIKGREVKSTEKEKGKEKGKKDVDSMQEEEDTGPISLEDVVLAKNGK
jgi:histidinol phosphatase-like PHP family hydrolase